MLRCHTCGGNLHQDNGVQRVLRTGNYSGGAGYYRTVNLCSRCDEKRTKAARQASVKIAVLILLGAAALVSSIAYFWWFR